MAEVYPSDSTLLNIQSDIDTGVEFISTGQSPYYMQFRKLLHRLITATKCANELRVYDEGGLNIGVKSGSFWFKTHLIEYGGSSGNVLADNKDDIYIYLDKTGNLVTDEYDDFADMDITANVRLAIVKTSGGDIESITDCRGGFNFVIPHISEGDRKLVEEYSSDHGLDAVQSGTAISNRGATGTATWTLPVDAPEGVIFYFVVLENQELRIEPGVATIMDGCGQTAGKYKYSNVAGSTLTVVSDTSGDWLVISRSGTWTEEV